jgi:hypothetical protein
MEGRTPSTVFKAGLKQARAAAGTSPRKEEKTAA